MIHAAVIFVMFWNGLSMSTWGSIICLIILLKKGKNAETLVPILIMSLLYILFLMIEFSFSIWGLLCSKTNKKTDEIISDFTQALPEINFTCYENIYNWYKISTLKFPYVFCMDIIANLFFDKEEIKKNIILN